MSAEDALKKFSQNQISSPVQKKRKRNKTPEKDVEKECMSLMNEYGFSMNVVEARAVYNARAGRYISGQVSAGFTDSAGCTPLGWGAFVEFKAKGRLSTLRENQREFIKDKIYKGCFAVVVDSAEKLKEYYETWNGLEREDRIPYLLSKLPKKKESFLGNSFLD